MQNEVRGAATVINWPILYFRNVSFSFRGRSQRIPPTQLQVQS